MVDKGDIVRNKSLTRSKVNSFLSDSTTLVQDLQCYFGCQISKTLQLHHMVLTIHNGFTFAMDEFM